MLHLFFPLKVLEKNSDLKSQQIFEEVIGLLKACKDGAVDRIFKLKKNKAINVSCYKC